MDAERWQRLSPLLDVLLELTTGARETQLQVLRSEDPQLAAELEKLLALEEDGGDFIASPLLGETPGQLKAGTMFGPYKLEKPLGEGGMGTVWLASRADGLYQRRVALKLLRPGLVDPGLRARFDREREILARLEHPNIARLLDAGIDAAGRPYLALEHVLGVPITDYCRNNALPVEARLKLFLQVCDAVTYAHANLVVHRDLKPSNILVTAAGEVRLLDFGIAKLLDAPESTRTQAHTEVRAFTLHYAAPEQVRGGAVTAMTDVYTLGVVLYELLADAKPYRLRRQTDAEWEQAILAVEPLKPSATVLRSDAAKSSPETRKLARRLAGDLDNIALKALAKAPEQRYASVEALAADLRRHLEGRPIRARAPSLGYRLRKYLSRQRWQLAAAGAIAALLLAALAVSLRQTEQARREARRAQAMQDFVVGLFDGGGAQQGTLDARQLLQEGERRGDRELANQPLARAELLDVIARLRIGMGDYPEALASLRKQQNLLAAGNGAPPSLQVEAATQHGRALHFLGRDQACLERMASQQPQAARLRAAQAQAAFYTQLGSCEAALGRRQDARVLFERALALRRGADDGVGIAENTYDLARLDDDAGRPDIALRGFDQALSALRAHADASHPLAIDILRERAKLARDRGDTDGALADYARALAIAAENYGERHPVTLGLRRKIAAVQLVDLGRFREAETESRALHALTLETSGAQSRDAALSWNTLGVIALELGRDGEAVADIGRAVAIWRRADGTPNLSGGLLNYGTALHAAGRDDEALQALQEARGLRVQRYGASHPSVGAVDREIGKVLSAQGRQDEAMATLDRAYRLVRIGDGPDHPETLATQLALARQYGRIGREAEARDLLQQVAAHKGEGSEYPKLRWQARAYLAELQCRGGARATARRDLDALLAELHAARPDGGAIVREAEAIRAGCR